MTNRYKNHRNAVINPPFRGNHGKTDEQRARRHTYNQLINKSLSVEEKAFYTEVYRNSKGVYHHANW